ncbi:MAG TPA: hypothetical protein DEQ38_07035 [Elusimicrobia bacterium]|nr:hypothetical protein [Elusimicrobiota bacterium]
MSGTGNRFLQAGYKAPKPLIEADGRPLIEHVVGMYPGEKDIIFICSKDHLRETPLEGVLRRIAPGARIVPVDPHKKGPVFAVSQAAELIKDDEEVIVSYCDFSRHCDYAAFLSSARGQGADGAVTAYRGFHPHMLYPTNYAFIREEGGLLREIREKQPFTADRMAEFASDGSYYFRKGAYVKKYFAELMALDLNLNGEYYVSLVYNLLVRDGLKVSVHEIEHMLQWGAPRDLEEYQKWSDYFRAAVLPQPNIAAAPGSINLMPLAGRGARFASEGWAAPKPLAEVSGRPMAVQAASCLPRAEKNIFVCLNEHLEKYPLRDALRAAVPGAKIVALDGVTGGQACTCELGLRGEDPEAPLLIAPSDWGFRWDAAAYAALAGDPGVDAVLWSFTRHRMAEAKPEMFGWIEAGPDGAVRRVSVKAPVSADPYNDHGILAVFFFRKARFFLEGLRDIYARGLRVNGEFYADSVAQALVESGRRVKVFPVDHYASWGTPDELRTFEYWQSYFHKAPAHPYRLEKDISMAPGAARRGEKAAP